ncbi:MAG: hypothetical protein K2W81_02600 [Sphingomonas sp.]|uniref:hypothetical protein n=1 Tax=Sphingomonas sp. TaxID=28214 RepID=UPI0025E489D4|nr:hypothetical protein [Sphingomonas sp.]MBY0282838.1 hypothetical protein [Sphingomonas sp.]
MTSALPRKCLTPRQPGRAYAGKRAGDGGRPQATGRAMIDNFALGLSHLLMMIAAIILLRRRDLDREDPARKDDTRA